MVDVDTRKSHLSTAKSAPDTQAHAPQVVSAQWMGAAMRRKQGREGEEERGGNASGGSVTE